MMARMTKAPSTSQLIRPSEALRAWLQTTLADQGWDSAAIQQFTASTTSLARSC